MNRSVERPLVEHLVCVKIWATWILYPVLVDLTERVAEALNHPFSKISMEMVYRGLYHFVYAYQAGEYTDPVQFLADEAKLLGIVNDLAGKRYP